VRSFLCSRNAHDQNVLVRRPQSKAPHSRSWVALKVKRNMSGRAQWETKQAALCDPLQYLRQLGTDELAFGFSIMIRQADHVAAASAECHQHLPIPA
jgi:hypothetical protein